MNNMELKNREIKEVKIKCSFTQEIPEKFELGQDVQIIIKGSIVSEQIFDNQDGSVNIRCICKPLLTEIKKEDL